ncbi:MAG: TM2 domain-containing protein [Clostridia bacterium]|nr:TM2 domain-containing protein [Clostridia bacterium]
MYCKNCGEQIDAQAAVCVKCGFQNGTGNSYCQNCGSQVAPGASVCMSCGYALEQKPQYDPALQKSKLAAGLLGILLGAFGVHNFYLGFTGKAVAQLLISVLTCGVGAAVSGVWGLVEGIMILTGSINKDAKGIPLKD